MRLLPPRMLARSAVIAGAACAVAVPACAAPSGSAAPAAPPAVATAPAAAALSQAAAAAAPAAAAPSQAATAAPCGRSFTLGAKSHRSTRSRPLVYVRAGRHTCYDRLVLEFGGPVNGYTVRYVKQVLQDGSGKPVPLAGRAKLQVTVVAPAYDAKGKPTFTPADPAHVVDVSGYAAFRQVAWAGSYEGYSTLGVGVRRGLPFRVLVLPGPGRHTRIVVDVAHNR
jgi:hypothetical protein